MGLFSKLPSACKGSRFGVVLAGQFKVVHVAFHYALLVGTSLEDGVGGWRVDREASAWLREFAG